MTAGVGSFGSLEGSLDGTCDPSAEVLAEAAAAFGLLASSARLHLVWALAQGESDVSGLAERVGGALPAISQHLAKLKLAGLVRSRREGRRVVYLVDDPDVVTIVRLMVGQLAERRAETADTGVNAGAGRLRGLGA
ncbi:ArsR/SmtB family transcription factor [Streptomyces abikoensis]|uniref:ArsR/SmtB family transcription factor n=1 Tax=Streptomyces abikoensis TaxID=97398 RepID=UPI001679352A|nr:metalloregulator ArsR/SmtB family transcription factor [Streptomyces abikoensis]GGP51362.1 transcriptional regulator [Streptomyces abikoensis]